MTKADLVKVISLETGENKAVVKNIVESFTKNVKKSLVNNDNVYLRGFGSFIIIEKAEKVARDIRRNKKMIIPAHSTLKFKPVKSFVDAVKENVN